MLKLSTENPFNEPWKSDRGAMPMWVHNLCSQRMVSSVERFLPLIAYSVDRFLPVVRLREYHYSKIELRGWLVYYFYFHQMMGFILASLLIAGVTGLAEK